MIKYKKTLNKDLTVSGYYASGADLVCYAETKEEAKKLLLRRAREQYNALDKLLYCEDMENMK